MKASPVAYELIKHAEGLRLKTYLDTGGVKTIGWGHTGPDVKLDAVITEARADELLLNDVAKAENTLTRYGLELAQHQYDALVSFVFNVGPANFAKSTLLRRLKGQQWEQAANEIPKWVWDDGHKLDGLIKRRAAEEKLFRGQA